MKLPSIIQNRMVRMVQLEQMLQRPRGLLMRGLDLVDLRRRDAEHLATAAPEREETGEGEPGRGEHYYQVLSWG